jgi:hypothetical protein
MERWEDLLYDELGGEALTGGQKSVEEFRKLRESASPNCRRGSADGVCACECSGESRSLELCKW